MLLSQRSNCSPIPTAEKSLHTIGDHGIGPGRLQKCAGRINTSFPGPLFSLSTPLWDIGSTYHLDSLSLFLQRNRLQDNALRIPSIPRLSPRFLVHTGTDTIFSEPPWDTVEWPTGPSLYASRPRMQNIHKSCSGGKPVLRSVLRTADVVQGCDSRIRRSHERPGSCEAVRKRLSKHSW